ncbi:MAG: hypothetical protein LUE95_06880, partial [Oscillospiraceae bacterium]|nr:hypothetical protein [Oscillospiraceae bacterium]
MKLKAQENRFAAGSLVLLVLLRGQGFAPAATTYIPAVRKVGKGTGQSFASAEATYFRCAAKVSKDAPEG